MLRRRGLGIFEIFLKSKKPSGFQKALVILLITIILIKDNEHNIVHLVVLKVTQFKNYLYL
ncbi:hypothetical protein B4N84_08405 [Flavobacterium sp. IR1]|nr:hypothetical protein B4N84_08405 [Flavobacterium sp. IR1]